MPKIGRINVPDTLWKALVENAARDFTGMAFDMASDELEIDLSDASAQLDLENSEATIRHMYNCIAALVRIQTGNFLSDDKTIEESDDYNCVLDAVRLQGDQIAYNTISSNKQFRALKALIDSNWKDMNTDLPSPP